MNLVPTNVVDTFLNEVNYSVDPSYVPSDFALEFVNFIKLVNGGQGEENLTPVLHYRMLDQISGKLKNILNMLFRGSAKLESGSSRILTPAGWSTMRDVQVGDWVINRYGKPVQIDYKTEPQYPNMYEVIFSDGVRLEVGDEHNHITTYSCRGSYNEKVRTTEEMYKTGITFPCSSKKRKSTKEPKQVYRFKVPLIEPVQFTEKDLNIAPYTMGYGLANGSFSKSHISTHSDDNEEIKGYIINDGFTILSERSTSNKGVQFKLKGHVFKEYSDCRSRTKYVPEVYKQGSITQRHLLLQGLMDGDGSISKNGTCSYCSFSEILANDVRDIVRSLGGISYVKSFTRKGRDTQEYLVSIKMGLCPFRLKRKVNRWKPTKKRVKHIVAINPIKIKEEGYCIHVNSPDHSYITEGYTLTHNTSLFGEYLFLYIAVYGKIPGFGKVPLALYVSDSIENGVKNMRKNLEYRWENSDFLREYVPDTRFTDVRWEFNNKAGNTFIVKGYGARTGVRGSKELGKRPCHAIGSIITTDMGTHKVEEYPNATLQKDDGYEFSIYGLPFTETVSKAHKYWVKAITIKRAKIYVPGGYYNKNRVWVGDTKSSTVYTHTVPNWTEAQNIVHKEKLGNQRYKSYWLGEQINYNIVDPFKIQYSASLIIARNNKGQIIETRKTTCMKQHPAFKHTNFWWLYGLWLADGHRSKNKVGWSIAFTEESTIGKKLKSILKHLGYTWHTQNKSGCYQLEISDTALSSWLKETKRGNSIKDMPNWVLKLDYTKQKEILLGYIAGDGYIDYANNQVRINSVNLTVLKQLGNIAGRLGLPYHIRNTKKAGKSYFPGGYICATQHQWEIRFRQGVANILDIAVVEVPQSIQEVFIEDGYIWRRFKKKKVVYDQIFVPITTPTSEYTSDFGRSHNCLAILDDLVSDEDARSPTVIASIEDTVYKAIDYALHPTQNKIIWNGTPFNSKDPLYKAVESGAWHINVFPVCEYFPCSKEEFKGAWEDRFPYEYVKKQYDKALKAGKIDTFNQELMLRIMSEEDRLIQDADICWYKHDNVLKNKGMFNFYITTDYATTENTSGDFSVTTVWAYNNNGDWLWVDGEIKKQLMDKNVDDLFKFSQEYNPQQVGIEVTGQQGGFIPWIQSEMMTRNIFFNLASDGNNNKPGIRPTTNKMQRFNVVVPLFKLKKVYFPEELRKDPRIIEAITELSLASASGFKSKHDDFIDNVSMLPLLKAWKPSFVSPVPVDSSNPMWEDDTEDQAQAMDSYIV